jgi:tetratricopeptide (TPR) repeat protein
MSERAKAMPPSDALRDGEAAERRDEYAAAAASYRRAAADRDRAIAAQAMFRLGRVAWRQGHLDDALEHYERAREAAIELRDDELRANAENGVGSVHCQRGAYAQARAAWRTAFDLTRDAALRGRIHLNLGVLAAMLGETGEAKELYEQAARAFDEGRDDAGSALALHNLALLHAEAREWEEAEAAYAKCLVLAERLGDRRTMASVLLNRAELLCARERHADALACCERAKALYAELRDEAGRAAVFRWQGEAYRRLRRVDEAEPRLKEAIRIAGRLQLLLLEAEAARELGLLKAANGDATSATKWLRRALARFSMMSAEQQAAAVEEQLNALKPWRPSGERTAVR